MTVEPTSSMDSMPDTPHPAEELTTSRRAVVRALGAGGVGAAVAAVFGRPERAAAQISSTTTTTSPTTTSPTTTSTTTTSTTTTSTTPTPTTTTTTTPSTTTTTTPPSENYVRTTDVRLQTGNVKHFGAVGDGMADDTAAIQAAIDAHYLVYFPAGTYKCLSTLRLRNGSHLLGEARGQAGGGGNVVQIDSRVVGLSANPAAVRINAGSSNLGVGITIENIWIKGSAASSPDYGYALFPSYGVYAGPQTNGLTIRESAITGFTVNVALLDATYCKIDHCYIARAVNTNLLVYGVCNQIKVSDTQFVVPNETGSANRSAVLSNVHLRPRNALQFPRWVSIENCLIDEVAKNGQTNTLATLRLDRSEDVSISETIIYIPVLPPGDAAGGYGVAVGSGCKRVSLHNVRVEPYSLTSRHVPLQTILIDEAAEATSLTNVTTVANGGGDIADRAADTRAVNVNGVSRLHRVTDPRPAPADAGVGAVVYDVVLKQPIFSDGQTWRDANGTVV